MCDSLETVANVGTFGTFGMAKNVIEGKGLLDDGNFGYFDYIGGKGDDGSNGAGWNQEAYMNMRRNQFDQFAEQYTNPEMYQAKLNEQMANSRNRIGSQYANIGLAGSSASIGSMNESDRLTQLESWDRQLRDRVQIEQIRGLYTTGLNNIDIGRMNQEAADKAADNQLIGGILGAAGTAAGAYFGGPMGAAAGSKLGSVVPGQNYQPMEYQQAGSLGNGGSYDPYAGYGEQGNYWNSNPYSY